MKEEEEEETITSFQLQIYILGKKNKKKMNL